MNFDFSAILDKIDVDAIMTKITDLITQIDFSAILDKLVGFIMGLITK